MKPWLNWIIGVPAAVALGVAALYTLSHLRGPTNDQRAALALMEQPMAAPGRNAFAAIWLLPYDVPPGELTATAEEDARRFAACLDDTANTGTAACSKYTSVAAERYPQRVGSVEMPASCSGAGCLADARARRDEFQRWREQNADLIERVGGLSQYGHHQSGLPPSFFPPLPPLAEVLPTLRADRALTFVQGRTDLALSQVCTDVITWRRLAPNSDSLVMGMFGQRVVTELTRLFADMLVELPAGQAVPAACSIAFKAPAVAELSLCEPMKGELKLTRASFARMAASEEYGAMGNVFFSRSMTDAGAAARLAQACEEDMARAFKSDKPVQVRAVDAGFRLDCVRNLTGCMLNDIAAGAYRDYQLRAQDHGMKLKLAGTLLWLREHSGDKRALEARLAERPVALRSAERDVAVVAGALRVPMYGRHPSEYFDLPLPAHVRPTASVD